MLKILKYLKPFMTSIIVVVALLFVQAVCDLSLPDYMSHIVNVGIQQGGVENAVPKVMSKSEFDKINIFMNEDDKKKVEDNYILLDKKNLSESELQNYVKQYPLLQSQPLYKLNTEDKDTISELNTILGKPILIVGGIEKAGMPGLTSGLTSAMPGAASEEKGAQGIHGVQGAQGSKPGKNPANLPANTDPFLIISKMPKEQIDAMKVKIDEKLKNMPESMITQSAVTFIQKDYKNIGINTDKLQSNYILMAGFKMLLLALLSMVATVLI